MLHRRLSRSRQRGSALIVVMSLTTATAMIVTTRLLVGTEIIHIDQNSLHALNARLAGESQLRRIEAALVTRSLSTPPVDRTDANPVHVWLEPTTPDGAVVEYLGCKRLSDVPLNVCDHSDTQGLAVHAYRVSIRMDTLGGVIRLQSLYHTHQAYDTKPNANNIQIIQSTTTHSEFIKADEQELLQAGRSSWISF